MWTRWLSTVPKYLAKRGEVHNLARLGTQPNVLEEVDGKIKRVGARAATPKDTTLQVTVSVEAYEFSSYSGDQIVKQDIEYGHKFEGWWNYVHFGYKRFGDKGIVKGYVQFGLEGEIKESTQDVNHEYLLEYLEFVVGSSNAPLFNGQMTKIQFQVGPGAYLASTEIFKSVIENTLPEKAMIHPVPRTTLQLIGAQITMPKSNDDGLQYQFDKFNGAKEYSVSGWVKWSGIQKSGKIQHVVTMAQKRTADLDGKNENTLAVYRSDEGFTFATYGCINLDCSKVVDKVQSYGEYWDQWTYVYFGYSLPLKKAFGYNKFTFTEASFSLDKVEHFYLAVYSVLIGKQKQLFDNWQGYMKTWVMNVGDGAYREGGFDVDENVKVHFGYIAGTDHIKLQQAGQEAHHEE